MRSNHPLLVLELARTVSVVQNAAGLDGNKGLELVCPADVQIGVQSAGPKDPNPTLNPGFRVFRV